MFYSAHILDRNTLFHTNISPKAANARKLIDFLSSETFHFIIYDCISNTCYTMKNINRIRSFNIRQRNMEFVSNLIWNLTRMFKCISKKQTNLERIRKTSYTIYSSCCLLFYFLEKINLSPSSVLLWTILWVVWELDAPGDPKKNIDGSSYRLQRTENSLMNFVGFAGK